MVHDYDCNELILIGLCQNNWIILESFTKKKLQGNTAATASTQPKFSVDEKPTKDPQEGENFPLGGQYEATKNTPAPSGDSKRKDQSILYLSSTMGKTCNRF